MTFLTLTEDSNWDKLHEIDAIIELKGKGTLETRNWSHSKI